VIAHTDKEGEQASRPRPKIKFTPPQALVVGIVFAAISIWMIVDPSVSTSRFRGPHTLAACRAMGAVGLVLFTWMIFRLTRMVLSDRRRGGDSRR
jgi:hypothetical protein